MKTWKITYYSNTVQEQLLNWPKGLLAKYLRITDLMQIYGAHLGMPLSKALGNGMFEMRVKAGEGIGRVFYCTMVNKNIIVLHSCIKKTQKIPNKELKIAFTRMLEIKNGKA